HGRPEDGFGADQCQRTYRRDRSCVGPWRQAEQINAGVFFTVVTVIFLVKVCRFIYGHQLMVSRCALQSFAYRIWLYSLLPSSSTVLFSIYWFLLSLLQGHHPHLPAQQYISESIT